MTDINSKPSNASAERILTDKEKLIIKNQNTYDVVNKSIADNKTKILRIEDKRLQLAAVMADGSEVEKTKADLERKVLKESVEGITIEIKKDTASNATLMRQINRLKEEVIHDSKGKHAINIETITKTKISDVEKGIAYLMQLTNTDNFQDFITDVKKKFTSFE